MKIVIIGNGISGITAARNIRKNSDHEIVVISGETDYFYSRTALMYIYMGHMKFEHTKPYEDWFWSKNRIALIRSWIENIDPKNKKLYSSDGKIITYDKLILACGSLPNKFGWPGQDLEGVQSLYSIQDLELLEQNTRKTKGIAVIIGGGLIGVELAEMLLSRSIAVTMLVRESNYWDNVLPEQEAAMISRHIKEHGVDLRLSTELVEIAGDKTGKVKEVVTNKGETIECSLVGLTTGVRPNIDWLKNSEVELQKGILVNKFFQTNLQDVYAIGDCAQFKKPPVGRKAIEQVWYTGKIQGETLARNICDPLNRTPYDPGPWFNSAKFFDIEYQTYGVVSSHRHEDEDTIYWEHPDERKCMRLVFHKTTGAFVGINVFGMRYRHDVFEQWLRQGIGIEEVLSNLSRANFDPEFFDKHENEIWGVYKHKFQTT